MNESLGYVGVVSGIGTAVYAAIGLDYLATAKLGLSLQMVQAGAMLIALLIGAYIAIEFFGNRLRKDS
jgi:hypothetical protein